MTGVLKKLAVVGLPALLAAAFLAPTQAAATGGQPAGSVVPASAPADCPAGDLCFWVDANYVGAMGKFAGNNPNWGSFAQPQCTATHTWNDCASAIYSHGKVENARVFKDINGGGGGSCLPRGTLWSNLTSHYFDNGVRMNDQISSNDWITSACP